MTNNQTHRPHIITGNWKMNKTLAEAQGFIKKLLPEIAQVQSKVYLAVPFTILLPLTVTFRNTPVVIGAQNMNDASEGAFTGEIAGRMLRDAGAKFVLVGHSERRHLYHEDNAFINRKVKKALEVGLQPILCVGETAEQHQAGQAHEVVRTQLLECLKGVHLKESSQLVIAYEPVWAVGSGESATPAYADEIQAFCRQVLAETLSSAMADQIVIQYGGSVTPLNAAELLSQPNVDGLLIGGASLSAESFIQIIHESESTLNLKVKSV